jgi:hypothetical protein
MLKSQCCPFLWRTALTSSMDLSAARFVMMMMMMAERTGHHIIIPMVPVSKGDFLYISVIDQFRRFVSFFHGNSSHFSVKMLNTTNIKATVFD